MVLFFLVAFGSLGYAQSADSLFIRRLADEILDHGGAYGNLTTLTKKVGPRLSGNPGYYKAESWGLKAMEAAGAEKAYLQQCLVPHWTRGGKDTAKFIARGFAFGNGSAAAGAGGTGSSAGWTGLNVLALGNSVGTGAAGVEAPILLINSFEELEAKKDQVKGKIVFFNYKFKNGFVETFRSYGDAVRYRVFGPSQAAKYGAVAVLVRSMSHSVDNNPHTGALVYNDSFPKIPAAAVGLWDADKLANALAAAGSASGNGSGTGNGAGVGAGNGLASGAAGAGVVRGYYRSLAAMLPDTAENNVIGELRGSAAPNEVISVGGHLDSWDPAEGAMDDGAGCVQSIEVLRAFKALGYQPKHTLRAVLFANEENGGRGGEKYADEAKEKGEKHIFGLESDAGGFSPRGFTLSLTDEQLAAIQPWIKLLQPYGVYELQKGGGGADVSPLAPKLNAVVGELRPDSQRYFDYHHAKNDVLENVNKRELELGAVAMAALVYLVDQHGWTGEIK